MIYAWINGATTTPDPRGDRIDAIWSKSGRFLGVRDNTSQGIPIANCSRTGRRLEPTVTVEFRVLAEAFDVQLHVDAPDRRAARFNVNAWQGGVPTGGVTVTITTGG